MNRQTSVNRFTTTLMSFTAAASRVSVMTVKTSDEGPNVITWLTFGWAFLRCWRFSIGSAPLTSITKIDAQVRGGETRQDYKDTRRFPLEAPSCALLFRPCRLPDTCPPFSLREAWRFLIAHAVGISVRCRSFAPSWAVCTNPPFSPTAAPYPVTIVLSPTR